MARRKTVAKENHDRWLVSYADLVTLLFAFFVVMFASTQTDHTRAKQISDGVEKALKSGSPASPPKIAAILGGTVEDKGRGNAMLKGWSLPAPTGKEQQPLKDLFAAADLLRQVLQKEIKSGAVDVRVEERGVIIGLNSAVFFSTGDDIINPGVYPTLQTVAGILNRLPNPLRLEGHTDSVPINTPRFPSNWELSAARSIAMLRLFNERYKVARERMAVVGYADIASIAPNDTEEGRRRNRRVDIVIVSEMGLRAEARSIH
jgi:chemotaxis protein MotB